MRRKIDSQLFSKVKVRRKTFNYQFFPGNARKTVWFSFVFYEIWNIKIKKIFFFTFLAKCQIIYFRECHFMLMKCKKKLRTVEEKKLMWKAEYNLFVLKIKLFIFFNLIYSTFFLTFSFLFFIFTAFNIV